MKLNLKQSIALDYLEDSQTTELLFGGGAGGGKSIFGCYWMSKMCFKYPESRWVMGRASMKTLKETTFISFLKMAKMQGMTAGVHFHVTSPQQKEYPNCILFPNKSVILMKDLQYYPSDPEFDELGSLEITGGFIDEANQVTIKAKNILASRMRHNITEYGIVPKLLMTCNPAKNWTYKDFYKPYKENRLEPYRQFVQSLVTDNPYIDKSYYNNLLKLDKNSKQRLLYGNWEYDDDPSALINFDAICNLFTNTFIEGGEKYITGDVARFGRDSTVLCLWDGWRCSIKVFKGLRTTEVSAQIEKLRQANNIPLSNIIVDEDGVGGGVVDELSCIGFVNNSTPLPNPNNLDAKENYANLKSQCYFMLAEKINKNQMFVDCGSIEVQELLTEDLEQVKQYRMDSDTKRQVMPKDKVKELLGRSPDFSDALMMRMWFELSPQINYWAI